MTMIKFLLLFTILSQFTYAASSFSVCKQNTNNWAKISQPDQSDCFKLIYDDTRTRIKLQDETQILIDPDVVMILVPGNSLSFYDRSDYYWSTRLIAFMKYYAENWKFTNCMNVGAYGHMKFCNLGLLGDESVRLEQHKHELPFLKIMGNKKYDISEAIYYFTKPEKISDNGDLWVMSWPDNLKVNDMTKKGVKYDK